MQILLSGLATGAIYGLVAMGFAVAFYVTSVINFAQGQLLMVAIMVTAAVSQAGLPTGLGIVAGLAASAVLGALIYLLAVRPVLSFSRVSFALLGRTLGVAGLLMFNYEGQSSRLGSELQAAGVVVEDTAAGPRWELAR